MSDLDEISIGDIPKNSKLILLGDWFRKFGDEWCIDCYFWNSGRQTFRQLLPVDFLPMLTAGATFPRKTKNTAKGWAGTFKIPSFKQWEKFEYRDIPKYLHRADQYTSRVDDSVVYRLDVEEKVYWLPAIELARMLFFHSAEVARASIYQGNTWQLGKSYQRNWIGNIELSSNIPVDYLNNLQFRKFLTWLFFVPEAKQSFCSIFAHMNRGLKEVDEGERWTFDFSPPDLGNCEVSYVGFTGGEFNEQIYIREIRSISGIKSPNLETVFFSHPDDKLLLQSESDDPSENGKPNKPPAKIRKVDPKRNPKSGRKRYLLKVGRSGLNFDVEPNLRRSPRHVGGLPPKPKSQLNENKKPPKEQPGSLKEGKDTGKGVRADINNLEPPKLIEAPEKIAFFQSMLEQLGSKFKWSIQCQMGDVPRQRCRSVHLVDGRPRKFCRATIKRDKTTAIQVLEIELTKDESLSTLLFRSNNDEAVSKGILEQLMSRDKDKGLNAMSWKRQFNLENTIACDYLGHPDNKVKSEGDALESWVNRASEKIINL